MHKNHLQDMLTDIKRLFSTPPVKPEPDTLERHRLVIGFAVLNENNTWQALTFQGLLNYIKSRPLYSGVIVPGVYQITTISISPRRTQAVIEGVQGAGSDNYLKLTRSALPYPIIGDNTSPEAFSWVANDGGKIFYDLPYALDQLARDCLLDDFRAKIVTDIARLLSLPSHMEIDLYGDLLVLSKKWTDPDSATMNVY